MKNIIVGQSGGPTAVINSSLLGVFETAKKEGCDHVYGMVHGIRGLLNDKLIDISTKIKTDIDKEILKRTPSAFLGSCRYKLPSYKDDPKTYKIIFENLKKHNIDTFFYIGGNDSMDTIMKLSDYAKQIKSKINFIGVPKTIDNDLPMTDHSPGFGSAAKYIATTCKEIVQDGLAYDGTTVTVVEIMGRDAGWLTAASALAKGPDCIGVDLIYLPERVFDMDSFKKKVQELIKLKRGVTICVSEGIKVASGKYVCELSVADNYYDSFGHIQLSGTAKDLANMILREFKVKTRAIEFSTLQRCASHIQSKVDVTEAYNCGAAAVRAGLENKTGIMITLERMSDEPYICVTKERDVHKVANKAKSVPQEWITKDGTYVTQELVDYIKPLIQGENEPIWSNGVPKHICIK